MGTVLDSDPAPLYFLPTQADRPRNQTAHFKARDSPRAFELEPETHVFASRGSSLYRTHYAIDVKKQVTNNTLSVAEVLLGPRLCPLLYTL